MAYTLFKIISMCSTYNRSIRLELRNLYNTGGFSTRRVEGSSRIFLFLGRLCFIVFIIQYSFRLRQCLTLGLLCLYPLIPANANKANTCNKEQNRNFFHDSTPQAFLALV